MIKSVIALFVFALLLCVWIIDPFGSDATASQSAALSPTSNDGDRLGQPVALAAAPADTALTDEGVTRGPAAVSILPSPAAAAAAAPAATAPEAIAVVAPAPMTAPITGPATAVAAPDALPALRTFDAPLDRTIIGILAALGIDVGGMAVATPTLAQADARQEELTTQLADTLAGIAAVTGDAPRTLQAPNASTALESIVAEALRAGQSDADIDAEVNRAAQDGDIAVPGVLVRADGQVDTETLLQGILITAQRADGSAPAAAWAARFDGAAPVMHDVTTTDSLAALALAYYGDPAAAGTILRANSEILSSSAALRAGQTLIIPRQ